MKLDRKTAVKIALMAFILFLFIYYWENAEKIISLLFSAIVPMITGCVIAYVLNILMSFYEKHYFVKKSGLRIVRKTKRPVCLVASILSLVVVIALVAYLVVPEFTACIKLLVDKIPYAVEKFLESDFAVMTLPENVMKALSGIDWQKNIGNIAAMLTESVGSAATTLIAALSGVFSVILTSFIGIIFAIYFLLSKEKLAGQVSLFLNKYLPRKITERIFYVSHIADNSFRRYIVGQCAEAVILGVLCIVGMAILQLPYAAMIGTLIGITALVPIAGAYIGAAVGAIMIFTLSPIKALIFLIFIVVLQQFEGNVIYPKVVGKSLGLPAVYVLAAITIGGGVWGIGGMLLGVPIMSTVYTIIQKDIHKGEKNNKNDKEKQS